MHRRPRWRSVRASARARLRWRWLAGPRARRQPQRNLSWSWILLPRSRWLCEIRPCSQLHRAHFIACVRQPHRRNLSLARRLVIRAATYARAFSWGALAGLSFLPRVVLDGFVVAPASWRVPAAVEIARPAALARWRRQNRVPAAVQAGEGDELLYLDLRAAGACADLARLLAAESSRSGHRSMTCLMVAVAASKRWWP